MALPRSVTRISRDGVSFKSDVDRAKYLLKELQRAALRDTAKLIRKKMIAKLRKLPGLKKGKRPYRAVGYWVRGIEADLQIGFGNTKKGLSGDTWYGIQQELGTKNQPKREILRSTVMENIDDIRRVQGAYLSSIADENRAIGLIDLDGNPYYGDEEGEG